MTRSTLRLVIAALLVAGLQTGVLGYMIASRAAILRSGAEVLLKTAPVDPRDLLRGDYVILSYDISSVPGESLVGPRPALSGWQVLSVRLKKQPDGFWGISESSYTDLPPSPGSVVLKSTPFYYYASPDDSQPVRVDYGIERYYVPEGEGRVLEQAEGTEALSVAIRVSSSGVGQIRSLLLNGKPAYEEPLY